MLRRPRNWLGGNAISTALAYTPRPDSINQAGQIFSQTDMLLLRDICAQVIPKTSTAGAAEVDTHGFIDNQLYHCYQPEDQQKVISVLLKINQIALQRHQQPFSGTNTAQQLALLTDLEKPGNGFENQVALHPTLKDKWGMLQLEFNCRWSDNEKLMMEDAAEVGRQMFIKVGLENVTAEATERPPGIAIHELGTARMGRDPKTSVLNGYNQCHDVDNLFVTDDASFSSSATQNPSLTFMALTARAVDYAVKEIKQGRI